LYDKPHWDRLGAIHERFDPSTLDNATLDEMRAALRYLRTGSLDDEDEEEVEEEEIDEYVAFADDEVGISSTNRRSSYNTTRWLIYDLQYNVTNLILAAVQHNPDAPIIFKHWYPQLVTYARYQSARDCNFDFTYDDVDAANITELQDYYAGFGYDEIPRKAPAETGIIALEDLDEDEIKMAAFAAWVTHVYNPKIDEIDYEKEELPYVLSAKNIFDEDHYEERLHPDLPDQEAIEEDMENWREQTTGEQDTEEMRQYRDGVAKTTRYKPIDDEEFREMYRGHLVVACTGVDEDLEVAERITERFKKEFGKAVYVETRIMSLALPEDNVLEIWLESYEIDLLHSKKRALSAFEDWPGPADVDDKQLDWLTDQVRFLISDDARNSFRLETEYPVY
jgi:hypothetical protein